VFQGEVVARSGEGVFIKGKQHKEQGLEEKLQEETQPYFDVNRQQKCESTKPGTGPHEAGFGG